ncbi:desulfoferrodoxin family protein [Lachnospiraceae bacterium 62-35]
MSVKFFGCGKCGSIITFLKDTGVPISCCGERLTELVPGTSDGASEKHVPVVTQDGSHITVSIGSAEHPMLEEHYIEWVCLETKKGFQVKYLKPGQSPKAEFIVTPDDEAIAVYEYCGLHGLWKK